MPTSSRFEVPNLTDSDLKVSNYKLLWATRTVYRWLYCITRYVNIVGALQVASGLGSFASLARQHNEPSYNLTNNSIDLTE